ARGGVPAGAAQVSGVDEGVAGGRQLGDEGVVAAVGGGVEGAGRGREVDRGRLAHHVDVAGAVQAHLLGVLGVAAAQVGGEGQGRAGEVELGDEAVSVAVGGGVEGAGRGRKIRRGRLAHDVDAADGVYRDAVGAVVAAAAQVGGEGQRRAVGQQPRHEGVVAA